MRVATEAQFILAAVAARQRIFTTNSLQFAELPTGQTSSTGQELVVKVLGLGKAAKINCTSAVQAHQVDCVIERLGSTSTA